MDRQLLKDLHQHFSIIEKPTIDEQSLLIRIQNVLPFFPISSVCRDDLDGRGFDTSEVDDYTMQELAGKLSDDYCEQLFSDSLPIIAGILEIPEKGTVYCPNCNAPAEYDEAEKLYYCMKCDHEWQDMPESSNQ